MATKFFQVLKFLSQIKIDGDFLEIGSNRGDGSTFTFASIANSMGKQLYSVDIDQDIIERNKAEYDGLPFKMPITFCQSSGEDFLEQNKNLKFSVVLLDNFDWQWNPDNPEDFIKDQVDRYRTEFNLEMNNLNSQKVHLSQAIALQPLLTEQAIIVCDDTYWSQQHGVYVGKCGAAIPYLLSMNFKIVQAEHTGVILIRQ